MDVKIHRTCKRGLTHKVCIKQILESVVDFKRDKNRNLHSMAEAFGTDVAGVEKELAVLISEGEISARIDSHNKVLQSRSVNTRSSTFAKALEVGLKSNKEANAMLLRASVLRHNMVVVAPKKDAAAKRGNVGQGTAGVAEVPAAPQ